MIAVSCCGSAPPPMPIAHNTAKRLIPSSETNRRFPHPQNEDEKDKRYNQNAKQLHWELILPRTVTQFFHRVEKLLKNFVDTMVA